MIGAGRGMAGMSTRRGRGGAAWVLAAAVLAAVVAGVQVRQVQPEFIVEADATSGFPVELARLG